eukprot:357569-Chlamydomonas_euryale.AAC.1
MEVKGNYAGRGRGGQASMIASWGHDGTGNGVAPKVWLMRCGMGWHQSGGWCGKGGTRERLEGKAGRQYIGAAGTSPQHPMLMSEQPPTLWHGPDDCVQRPKGKCGH